MARAIGPDISFWQDDNDTLEGVNFDVMKTKSDFVIIRAGQCNWIDPDFIVNWTGAKDAELPRGSYWYYDSRVSPEVQAHMWVEALGDDLGEVALFADFEESYGGPWGGWHYFYMFLEELKSIMDEEIIIYTGYYYWKDNVSDVAPTASVEYFKQYALWIARYSESEPWIPEPWEDDEWTFWQYTAVGDGEAWGVESLGIDLNYYNGTVEEFKGRFDLGVVIPPVDPDPPVGELRVIEYRAGDTFQYVLINDDEPDPEPEPVPMQLVRKEGREFCVISRTPDTQEVKKIQLDFIEGAIVDTLPIPKYRLMAREGLPPHEVPNYETEADRLNLERFWAFLPIQNVQKSNLNNKTLHNSWTDGGGKGNWDINGSYISRDYLKEIGEPEPPAPTFEFSVPDTGNFVHVNHDWGSQYWLYQPRSSPDNPAPDYRQNNGDLPDTGKGKIDRFNPMPRDWQFLWRDVARYFAPDMHDVYDTSDFLSFPVAIESLMADTRAITDNHAAENGYINYVTGKNLNDPLGKGVIQVKEMFFGGNIGKVLEETSDSYILETFDMSKPAPTLEEVLRNYSHRIGWTTSTQCYRINDKWDGIESAKPFPQIRNKDNKRTGTPYLITGLNGSMEMRKTSTTRKCLTLSPIANGLEYLPYKYRS